MSRTFQLLVVAYLVCSTAVILLHLETALGLLPGILGLILVLQILKRWSEEYGRRCDPNFDKIYAAHSRKYQVYMMTTMMFFMVVYLFPVSDWKFWLCLACLTLNTAFTIGGFASSIDESMSCSPRNHAAQSRKWQLYITTIMTFLMVVSLFPVPDWKFWLLCMACLVTDVVFRYSRIRNEQSVIGTKLASNIDESLISNTKDVS